MTTDPSLRTRSTTDQLQKCPNQVCIRNKNHGDDYAVMMCLVYHFVLHVIKEKHKVITNDHNGDIMISNNIDWKYWCFYNSGDKND